MPDISLLSEIAARLRYPAFIILILMPGLVDYSACGPLMPNFLD